MMNEELFQASELRFRQVIEANADGIIIVNKSGIIRYANPAAEKLFGRSQEKLVGEIFGFPILVSQATEINIFNDGATTAEMRVVSIDWQEEPAYLASLRDITQRKQAEQELQAREHFLTWLNNITRAALETPDFQTMLQILADRLGELFDADGCYITVWDDARETAVPGAVSHHIQPHYQIVETDENQSMMTVAVLEAKQAIIVNNIESSPYAKTRTANLLPIRSILGLPLISGEQKLGAAFIIFKNLHTFTPTEVTQAEQVVSHIALVLAKAKSLKAERQQRQLAETLSMVISEINNSLSPEHVLKLILEHLSYIVDYDSASVMLLVDNILETMLQHTIHPTDTKTAVLPIDVLPHLQKVLTDRSPVIIPDIKDMHLDQQDKPVEQVGCWLGVPLVIKDEVIGLLSLKKAESGCYTKKDATVAMSFAQEAANAILNAQLHQQVQQHADELEIHVTERTQKLREAYEQLKELDQLKSKFIDDISHELRTPLTNLVLYLELMEKGEPANYPRYLSILNRETQRLRELVESILRLSQLDLGKDNTTWTDIDLNDVAADVFNKYQHKIDRNQLKLKLTLHTTALPVQGNYKQLVEITSNIVENAIKYSNDGEIHVQAFPTNSSSRACLQIEDTGMGIAAEDIPYIFDRFYRGQGASQSNVAGVGLGLTIVESIVNLHNGDISITSQPNQGTRVQVLLPLSV